MFCEVLLDSWTKEFYKREGKSNMKRTDKKRLKGERDRRLEKKLERGISQAVRSMYFPIFTAIFDILQIWM